MNNKYQGCFRNYAYKIYYSKVNLVSNACDIVFKQIVLQNVQTKRFTKKK